LIAGVDDVGGRDEEGGAEGGDALDVLGVLGEEGRLGSGVVDVVGRADVVDGAVVLGVGDVDSGGS
jgi:hypothetical protein